VIVMLVTINYKGEHRIFRRNRQLNAKAVIGTKNHHRAIRTDASAVVKHVVGFIRLVEVG